jgi:hypothetical protein
MSAETRTPRTAARYARLRRFNLGVGLLHLTQGVVLLTLANDLTLPVLATFLADDPVQQRQAAPELIFELPIAVLVAVFIFLAAGDHLLMAMPGIKDWYERKLDQRENYARWIEYSVSSSIMIVLIAAFAGIWDLAAVIAIFAVNTSMILFGLLWERTEKPGEGADWSAYWYGSFAGAVPWVIIGYYVLAAGDGVPGFVYAIVGFQLALFWSFALNMALQYAEVGRWRDYIFGEYAYIVLSLVAKTLLAWLIYANVLRT